MRNRIAFFLTYFLLFALFLPSIGKLSAQPSLSEVWKVNCTLDLEEPNVMKVSIDLVCSNISSPPVAGFWSAMAANATLVDLVRAGWGDLVELAYAQSPPSGTFTFPTNVLAEVGIHWGEEGDEGVIHVDFTAIGQGEPILDSAGRRWAFYEINEGFLREIEGGIVRTFPVWVTIDLLRTFIILPPGYSVSEIRPRPSSVNVSQEGDRVFIGWLFSDPILERRDTLSPGFSEIYLHIYSPSDEEVELLSELSDVEESLKALGPFAPNPGECSSLLNEVSMVLYRGRAFLDLDDPGIPSLIERARSLILKASALRTALVVVPLASVVVLLYLRLKS